MTVAREQRPRMETGCRNDRARGRRVEASMAGVAEVYVYLVAVPRCARCGVALDVTEFSANGCAFSRAIMPAAIFVEILRAAIGVEV